MNSNAVKIEPLREQEILPVAFKGAKISPEVRLEIQKLYGPRPITFASQIASAWMVIIGSIWAAESVGTWWATAIAVMIVATRQNIFGLLVHDQAHKLGFKGARGDVLTNVFVAYPLIAFSVENYAKAHLTHHKYYFTEKDPDFIRKSGAEWSVPMPRMKLAFLFLRDLFGFSIIDVVRGKSAKLESSEFQRSKPTSKYVRPLLLMSAAALFTYFQVWTLFLIYWALPIATILPVIIRWGALCEHIYETPGKSIEENSPLIIPGRISRIILPNLNFSYHAYHHWYPAISFSNLPKVHEIYRTHGLIDESKVFKGNISYLRFITRQRG